MTDRLAQFLATATPLDQPERLAELVKMMLEETRAMPLVPPPALEPRRARGAPTRAASDEEGPA